jgi:ABC-type dipeptide/oligopeptide/nickel transport system ATPase component
LNISNDFSILSTLGLKTEVYAFVGASGTGKSYRAQMVANEYNIKYIIDDGILIKENDIINRK